MLLRSAVILFLLGWSLPFFAQPNPAPLNFKKSASGIEYCFVVDKTGGPKPKEGDQIRINMVSIGGNRYLYNSFQQNKGKPVEFGVAKPAFKGDIIEIINMMNAGDSVVCLIDADVVYKNTKQKKPDFIKKGDKIQYMIKLVSIKPKEIVQKEQQALINKQIKEQMAKQQKEEQKLIGVQEKELQKYFIANNLTPLKTASGLYYVIKEEGAGAKPVTNDTVSLNYRGKLINGTIFDSNIDSAFNHMSPFEFPLGIGRVIKGWDEGVALLSKGTKATFFIPSRLGYSTQAVPGNPNNPKGIPANSILIFDVELMNIKPVNKQ